jgi:hypothetical protein
MTVPTDKEFILTDIIATSVPTSQNIYLSVKEDSVMKNRSLFVAGNTGGLFNLTSGIPFSPGADVVFKCTVCWFSGISYNYRIPIRPS